MRAATAFARCCCRSGGLLGLLSLVAGGARAQTAPAAGHNLVVKIMPQYVVVGGYWLEVERRWARHPGQSFSFTPQLYAGPPGRPDVPTSYYEATRRALLHETVRGVGGQVQHRLYLGAARPAGPAGLYLSYGASLQHFALARDESGWEEGVGPTGLPFYQYRARRRTETITRYGALGQIGYQAPLAWDGRLLLEVYAGLGWRTGQSRENGGVVASRYASGPSDYGHQGWYFPAGFKLGVALGTP